MLGGGGGGGEHGGGDQHDFNTNLPDKDERKAVRRARMEARTADADPEARGWKDKESEDEMMRFKGQQQIANSLKHLDGKKANGIDVITGIRVKADWAESQRRIAEETQRQQRLKALQEEAVRSGKQNASVEMRWAELLDKNIPQELFAAIEEQRQNCAAIISSKDALIAEFHLQLKMKDEEYVKALKAESEDIEVLLSKMRSEFKELQTEYEVELLAIEDAFLTERRELLQANKREIDGLFDRRKQAELNFMAMKQKREEQHQQEIEDVIVHDSEEYNKLKIKLETDIQTLEQQLEEMQATYQLNTEKLEYNYRVLTERDNENSNTLQQLKRKQTKLKDTLSALMTRYHEMDARDRKKNDELTDQYRSITKQYKDLQSKFRHFELADNKRFDQLWAMHEEEVAQCISKVLQADELIQTQQLGWKWQPPDLSALRFGGEGAPAAGDDLQVLAADGGGTAGFEGRAAANVGADALAPGGGEEGVGEGDPLDDPAARMVSGAKMQAMMQLLVSEAGFLVDSKVKEAIALLPPEESELAQAESMLRALGVESESDVQVLMAYFFPARDPEEEDAFGALGAQPSLASATTGGQLVSLDGGGAQVTQHAEGCDEGPEALKELKRMIGPDDVIRAVGMFVEERKAYGEMDPLAISGAVAGAASPGPEAKAVGTAAGRSGLAGAGGSGGDGGLPGGDTRTEERAYWDRASSVISDETVSVWSQLEKAMQQYNSILSDRAAAIDEVSSLQQQNASLKELLHTYLGARVNDELIVPPNQTIKIGD
jgi:dynein regulatory complex protein 1